jgi:AcrR family transcriptional regulator
MMRRAIFRVRLTMNVIRPAARRRNNTEDTRRRILDVVVETVIEVGYYKASSNEIARRAGVTWGTIQHLFGSRDQLMLDVVNYVAGKMEALIGAARIDGETLEKRLEGVLDVLAESYDGDVYLVQMQILLELSANPRMSALAQRVIDRETGGTFDRLAQPLLAKAIGDVAANSDLVYYVFLNFRGFLISSALSRRIAKLPEGVLNKPMGGSRVHAEPVQRRLLIQGVAATIRAEAEKREMEIA